MGPLRHTFSVEFDIQDVSDDAWLSLALKSGPITHIRASCPFQTAKGDLVELAAERFALTSDHILDLLQEQLIIIAQEGFHSPRHSVHVQYQKVNDVEYDVFAVIRPSSPTQGIYATMGTYNRQEKFATLLYARDPIWPLLIAHRMMQELLTDSEAR